LKTNGSDIDVTDKNKKEFVKLKFRFYNICEFTFADINTKKVCQNR
jgi:hypothetical protein